LKCLDRRDFQASFKMSLSSEKDMALSEEQTNKEQGTENATAVIGRDIAETPDGGAGVEIVVAASVANEPQSSPRRPPLPLEPPPVSNKKPDEISEVQLKAESPSLVSDSVAETIIPAFDLASDESSSDAHLHSDVESIPISSGTSESLMAESAAENHLQPTVSQQVRPPLPPTPPPKMLNTLQNVQLSNTDNGSTQGHAPAAELRPSSASHSPAPTQRKLEMATEESVKARDGDGTVSLDDVYDSLLAAARDGAVSGSAGRSLGRLAAARAGEGVPAFIERSSQLLNEHARSVTDDAIRDGLPHRVALYRIVGSVLSKAHDECAPADRPGLLSEEAAGRLAAIATSDLTAIKIAALAVSFSVEAGSEWDLQRAASRMLVALSSLHLPTVLSHLLPKLETCSMFSQQQAQRKGANKAGFQAQELCLMLVLFTLQDMSVAPPAPVHARPARTREGSVPGRFPQASSVRAVRVHHLTETRKALTQRPRIVLGPGVAVKCR
jgi:hypothetical protein